MATYSDREVTPEPGNSIFDRDISETDRPILCCECGDDDLFEYLVDEEGDKCNCPSCGHRACAACGKDDNHNSDTSSYNDSISDPSGSISSSITQTSNRQKQTRSLAKEIAGMPYRTYFNNSTSTSLDGYIFERQTRNTFRIFLKRFALDLQTEAGNNNQHQEVAIFISSFLSHIMEEFSVISHIIIPTGNQVQTYQFLNELFKRRDGPKTDDDYYYMYRGRGSNVFPTRPRNDSDQKSLDKETDEEPDDGSLTKFHNMRQFILGSTAYQSFCRRLHDFIYPSLGSELRNLLASWSNPGHRFHAYLVQYNLPDLVTELQYIDPRQIKFHSDEKVSRLTHMMSHYQNTIEHWTGEKWDWWPIPRFQGPRKMGQVRLKWECVSTRLIMQT